MKEFASLFRYVIAPERDWASFVRKLVSVLLCASLGALAFGMYSDHTKPKQLGELPVLTILEKERDKKEVIRRLMESILRSDENIKSVWLYSWPDALQLLPVMHVGDSIDPLPSGSLQRGDEYAIGAFLFGDCVEINRNFNNFSCPINGFQDSWGVLVVNYDEDPCDEMADGKGHHHLHGTPQDLTRGERTIHGVAQRIRNVLYGRVHPR